MSDALKQRLFAGPWTIRSLMAAQVLYLTGWIVWNTIDLLRFHTADRFQPVLRNLAFQFCMLVPLILCSLLLALTSMMGTRQVDATRKCFLQSIGITAIAASSLWVLNPLTRWSVSIIGDYSLVGLVNELFPFHLVSPAGMSVSNWCRNEIFARMAVVSVLWAAALVTVYKSNSPQKTISV